MAAASVRVHANGVHANGSFIAISTERTDAVFAPALEYVAATGEIVVGDIASVDAQWSWRYEIARVDYDPTAISVRELLARLLPNEPLELNVRVALVARAAHVDAALGAAATLEKATCRVRTTAGAKLYLRAHQSPQVPPWLARRQTGD